MLNQIFNGTNSQAATGSAPGSARSDRYCNSLVTVLGNPMIKSRSIDGYDWFGRAFKGIEAGDVFVVPLPAGT